MIDPKEEYFEGMAEAAEERIAEQQAKAGFFEEDDGFGVRTREFIAVGVGVMALAGDGNMQKALGLDEESETRFGAFGQF